MERNVHCGRICVRPLVRWCNALCGRWLLVLFCAASIPLAEAAKVVFATYLWDIDGNGVGVDHQGNTYVSGTRTNVIHRPGHSGGTTVTFDAVVTKISAGGDVLYSSSVRGGSASGLAVDTQGGVYLTGFAQSAGDVQATPGVFQTTGGPGFVTKLDSSGNVVWTGLLNARPFAAAIDAQGNVYVTGAAGANFRTTPGALKAQIGPIRCTDFLGRPVVCDDAFVAKISLDGTKLLYATLLGGNWEDSGTSIAVDVDSSVYVVGETLSEDFPTTVGAFGASYGGTITQESLRFGDGFAARLDPEGRSLTYSTFLGGSGVDIATGVAIDDDGNAVVVGTTQSEDFPVTAGAFQTVYGGGPDTPSSVGDVFYLMLDSLGHPVWASYLGGAYGESGGKVALGPDGQIYISVDGPLTAGLEKRPPAPCGENSAVVAVEPDGGALLNMQYLPTYGAAGVASDAGGLVHVAGGWAFGPNFFSTKPDSTYRAGKFLVARVDFAGETRLALTCVTSAASLMAGRSSSASPTVLAPGEIISLFGHGLGPQESAGLELDASGSLLLSLAGLQVKLGGQPLPLIYVQDRQVNAIVPFDVPLGETALRVEREGLQGGPFPADVVRLTPAVFTLDGSGRGQAAVLNQDGTINSASNPAASGSIVSFFATGFGAVAPLPTTPTLTPLTSPWPEMIERFELYIAGDAPNRAAGMEVLYAGPAPGAVPGLFQVNARIPMNAYSGSTLFRFIFQAEVGLERTQGEVFISVK